jgi:hypothetical protein
LGASVGVGPANLSGKIGPYVTCQMSGESTKVADYGVKDEAGVSVELGSAAVEAKAEARFGAETWLTVDYSARTKISSTPNK